MKKIMNWELGAIEALTLFLMWAKISQHITASWWWVTCPMWIPISWRALTGLITGLMEYGKVAAQAKVSRLQADQEREVGTRVPKMIGGRIIN